MADLDFTSLSPELAYALGQILGAWIRLKSSHDSGREFLCNRSEDKGCEKIADLFAALQRYEDLVLTGKTKE